MSFSFIHFDKRVDEIRTWLSGEFASVRTGRATPALLDTVRVDLFGAKTAINHIANISQEDAKTLRVTPWDKSNIKSIESAVSAANLGVSLTVAGSDIRVIFPDLTSERREILTKVTREKLEEARISIKKEREEVLQEISKMAKEKEISEDEKQNYKEMLQSKTDRANRELEEMADKKRIEISQ